MLSKRMVSKFHSIFSKKPIIGMIHLAGDTSEERLKRAMEELKLYDEEGINGAIIEDYHGNIVDVLTVLEESAKYSWRLQRGVNVLRNPYLSFQLAKEYGATFVQFDNIQSELLNVRQYNELRSRFPNVVVLGGVGFKYQPPTGNSVETDLQDGMQNCDAIVTTGPGTGLETPLEKLQIYKSILRDFPLISGAGVTLENVCDQIGIADGLIVGSYFKDGNTEYPVIRSNVRSLKQGVDELLESCLC